MSFRNRIALDGSWQFQIDPSGGQEVAAIQEWRTAQVPLPWQAQFDDLRHTSGVGWYRRTVTLDQIPDAASDNEAQSLLLGFGAVDYLATVWVNGQRVGEHEGGYLPFEFDISGVVRQGDNGRPDR